MKYDLRLSNVADTEERQSEPQIQKISEDNLLRIRQSQHVPDKFQLLIP